MANGGQRSQYLGGIVLGTKIGEQLITQRFVPYELIHNGRGNLSRTVLGILRLIKERAPLLNATPAAKRRIGARSGLVPRAQDAAQLERRRIPPQGLDGCNFGCRRDLADISSLGSRLGSQAAAR